MYRDTIACALKKRIEQRASEELLLISERCLISGWRKAESLRSFHTVLQDNREELGTLMHQMLVKENDRTHFSSSKTPLCPWQVCFSAKQHLGGYLDAEEEIITKRNVSFVKRAQPRCHRSNLTNEMPTDENNCAERDTVEEARAKSASKVGKLNTVHSQDGGAKLTRNTQSASCSSPTSFKFYHSNYTEYHIRNYREQITNESIRKYIYEWLRENNKLKLLSEKKSPNKTQGVKSVAIPKPSFTVYRFCISTKDTSSNDSGCLKVGPCPRMSEQKESTKTDANKSNKSPSSEKAKAQTNMAPTDVDRRLDQKRKKFQIKTISSLKFQNMLPPHRENSLPGPENDESAKIASKTETSEGKLKKVELRVHSSSDSPRIVPKTGGRVYVNKTKTGLRGVCTKPTIQICKSSTEIPRITRKPTFGDKEFLRITTPKPLLRYQSQTPSDFDESPGFSPDKSVEISPMRSPVPSMSGTSLRSQVIAEILMKREPQVVFPKNSNFQACITPSNYSTSRAEKRRKKRSDLSSMDLEQSFSEDQNLNENRVKRVSSQPSIPRIGPFISG